MSGSQSSILMKGGTCAAEPGSWDQNPTGFHFSAHFVIKQGKNIWLPFVDCFFLYLSCQNHYKIGGKLSETEATLNLLHLTDWQTVHLQIWSLSPLSVQQENPIWLLLSLLKRCTGSASLNLTKRIPVHDEYNGWVVGFYSCCLTVSDFPRAF